VATSAITKPMAPAPSMRAAGTSCGQPSPDAQRDQEAGVGGCTSGEEEHVREEQGAQAADPLGRRPASPQYPSDLVAAPGHDRPLSVWPGRERVRSGQVVKAVPAERPGLVM
jgi:hypothetical protein